MYANHKHVPPEEEECMLTTNLVLPKRKNANHKPGPPEWEECMLNKNLVLPKKKNVC